LQLREQYREALRSADVQRRPAELRQWLTDAEAAAGDLETALRAKDTAAADKHFGRVQKACQQCHDRYRDRKESP
jgi:cytochrome c556